MNSLRAGWSRFQSLGIRRNDLVVEVGSGDSPYWRSDIIVDKYVSDSTERPAGLAGLVVDRPFIVADAVNLPFRDGSIDYLVARNLVEHLLDPEAFLQEACRVARRGYVTAPSPLSEKLFGWQKHAWFVFVENGILVFEPKRASICDSELSRALHHWFGTSASFRQFYRENQTSFVTEYHWSGEPTYSIRWGSDHQLLAKEQRSTFDLTETLSALENSRQESGMRSRDLHRLLRRGMSTYRERTVMQFLDRLASPCCHAALTLSPCGDRVCCMSCGSLYPVVRGVPVLVAEE